MHQRSVAEPACTPIRLQKVVKVLFLRQTCARCAFAAVRRAKDKGKGYGQRFERYGLDGRPGIDRDLPVTRKSHSLMYYSCMSGWDATTRCIDTETSSYWPHVSRGRWLISSLLLLCQDLLNDRTTKTRDFEGGRRFGGRISTRQDHMHLPRIY